MKYIKWEEELIHSIAKRRAVIVIGSGVSKNSTNEEQQRPSSWEEFLHSCVEKCDNSSQNSILTMISERNYLMACELIKKNMKKNKFAEQIKHEYLNKKYMPAKIHEHIFNLDLPIIITPNFDCIYDTYSEQQTQGNILIKSYYDEDIPKYIRGNTDSRLIIKSHGTAKRPEKVIFTQQDYVEARTKYSLFYEVIKALILTHTFLFIGCGIDDPDIKMIFEDIRFSHGDLLPTHYMTIASDSIDPNIKTIFQDMTNITFLEYSKKENHSSLTKSLEELYNLVNDKRQELAPSHSW